MIINFLVVVVFISFFVFFMMSKSKTILSLDDTNAKYEYLCELETKDSKKYYRKVYSDSDKFSYQDLLLYINNKKTSTLFETADGKTVILDKPIFISLSFERIDRQKEAKENIDEAN